MTAVPLKSSQDALDVAGFGAANGAQSSLPRRFGWRLVRRYVQPLLERQVAVERDFDALKKELLAAQNRITLLEELLAERAPSRK